MTSLGEMIGILKAEDIEIKRANLQQIACRQIERHGASITDIRKPLDVETLKNRFGSDFLLVHVKIDNPQIGFRRPQKGSESRDPRYYESFLAQNRCEEVIFKISETIGGEEDMARELAASTSEAWKEVPALRPGDPPLENSRP